MWLQDFILSGLGLNVITGGVALIVSFIIGKHTEWYCKPRWSPAIPVAIFIILAIVSFLIALMVDVSNGNESMAYIMVIIAVCSVVAVLDVAALQIISVAVKKIGKKLIDKERKNHQD